MSDAVQIGQRPVGPGEPCYVIAEIGINHNGDLAVAKELVDVAVSCGCDAVKFQKRTPELCVPPCQQSKPYDTPWGTMSYLDYRRRVEFGDDAYEQIDAYCREKGIDWFASAWDERAVAFLERFDPPAYKIASATLTDRRVRDAVVGTGKPVLLSTGMSTMDEIHAAVEALDGSPLVLLHTTSTYPCPNDEINLQMIPTLRAQFPARPVGYSGHEVGLQVSLAAVALGACCVERHITLDRTMWGSDQAASVEPQGLARLVRDIRVIEQAMGDGVKKVYDSELPIREKLRRA